METINISMVVMGVFSMLTNGILLIILYLDPLKKFRTTTNYLIISLTISDFITGVVACLFPFNGIGVMRKITFALFWATILSSFFTIFFMSCERLIIVVYPLEARSQITKRRVFSFIASDWLLSALLGGLVGGLHNPELDYYMFVLFFLMLIMILLLVAIYVAIIFAMRYKPKLIRESMHARNIRHNERRLTSVLCLLVVILLITVVPYLFASIIFRGYTIYSKSSPNALLIFIRYYFLVELLNFAVNPIIYAWRLPNYRKSLLYYFRKLPFVNDTADLEQATIADPLTRYHSQRYENTFRLQDTDMRM